MIKAISCQDCKHFHHAPIFICKRILTEVPMILEGEKVVKTALKAEFCVDERATGKCGEEGKYFEPLTPTTDELNSMFDDK